MALPGMVRGRALRCDGLSMEFYFKFWHVLGDDLVLVLNSAFRSGSLSAPGYYHIGFQKWGSS